MRSGYSIDIKHNRPPTSIFPEDFVEDYTHNEVSDDKVLDENNGRFCITPEFPKEHMHTLLQLMTNLQNLLVFLRKTVNQFFLT